MHVRHSCGQSRRQGTVAGLLRGLRSILAPVLTCTATAENTSVGTCKLTAISMLQEFVTLVHSVGQASRDDMLLNFSAPLKHHRYIRNM